MNTDKDNPKILSKGFTLIELLIVIFIIGILIGLSVFGLQGARASTRDAQRKTDLEQIRSGLEIYKADCGVYPASVVSGSALVGTDTTCSPVGSIYITKVPSDPTPLVSNYIYRRLTTTTYTLCTALEQGGTGDVSNCGSCGATCSHKVTNP